MDTVPKTESLHQLVQETDKEVVVLPEFQRDFVWDIGKSFDLFDSMVKGIFVGSIIYGKPSFSVSVRQIDGRPKRGKGSRAKLQITSYSKEEIEYKGKAENFRLILDGQQRVTSIYRALKGFDEVWFVCKSSYEISEEFGKSKSFDELSLEDLLYQIAGNAHPERISVKLSNVYLTVQTTFREQYIKEKFFSDLVYASNLANDEEKYEDAFNLYLSLQNKLADFIKSETLLSYYLLETDSEKFALFFERSNSKGIQLNFIDILAAKLYVGFNLREKITEFEDEYKSYKLNREVIVRAIAFLEGSGKVDQGYILKTLDHGHFNSHWESVTTYYRQSLDYLYSNRWIISQDWLPYPNMLIPMITFLSALSGGFPQMTELQRKKLETWYWCSIFAERYSVNSNEVVSKHARYLSKLASGKLEPKEEREVISELRPKVERADDLLSIAQKGSALYKGTLNFISYKARGLKDWKNTSLISFNGEVHDHHIFPKQYIADKYERDSFENNVVDSVVNRTLIPKITNIKIGKKSPSTYLQQLQEENSSLAESLNTHLIPHSAKLIAGDIDNKFKEFLEERSNRLFQMLKKDVTENYDLVRNT